MLSHNLARGGTPYDPPLGKGDGTPYGPPLEKGGQNKEGEAVRFALHGRLVEEGIGVVDRVLLIIECDGNECRLMILVLGESLRLLIR